MSFRARLLLALVPLSVIPLLVLGLDVRRTVADRMSDQHEDRAEALTRSIEDEIERESDGIAERLDRVAAAMSADSRLRVAILATDEVERTASVETAGNARPAVVGGEQGYLLDYAADVMPLVGLDVLQIQTRQGTILSSGHFRQEYGLAAGPLTAALEHAAERVAVADVRTPAGQLTVLLRTRTVPVGTTDVVLLGGTNVDAAFLARLARGTGLDVRVEIPDRRAGGAVGSPSVATDDLPERYVSIPFVDPSAPTSPGQARFVVLGSDEPLAALLRELDGQLIGGSVAAAALALLLAWVVAAQIGKPVTTLARRAGGISIERLSDSFTTDRADEVGDLSRALDRMTRRLRADAAGLREAERRAATGDLARQVHHDVRNGLIPIRNVVTHLAEVARDDPDRTADVFLERQGTLESGLEHLHSLANTYAALSPSLVKEPCDLNAIVLRAVHDAEAAQEAASTETASPAPSIGVDLADEIPPIEASPLSLRRIVDNLLSNALQSLGTEPGMVSIRTRVPRGVPASRGAASEGGLVELSVIDTGRGMTEQERARAFENFYTTRKGGTGLGLSIVRRLVTDLEGTVEVESVPGKGSRFRVLLPGAPGDVPEETEGAEGS